MIRRICDIKIYLKSAAIGKWRKTVGPEVNQTYIGSTVVYCHGVSVFIFSNRVIGINEKDNRKPVIMFCRYAGNDYFLLWIAFLLAGGENWNEKDSSDKEKSKNRFRYFGLFGIMLE